MDRFEDHLQKRGAWYVAVASLLYFGLTVSTASRRPLWYDELFTYHVAAQERASDVLRALAEGADIHPPLDYLLRHFSMALLGQGELADRLPSILAFWVMCLALRHVVAMRCSAILAMVAFLAPLNTLAYDYAYEGRAYALMLAGSALALAGWQGSVEGIRRRTSLMVMGLGVATSVTAHYYGFLILIPLVLGEAVRAAARRRPDGTLALVLLGGAACSLLNWSFLRVQMAQVGTFWNQASLAQAIQSYWWLLNPGIVALVLFLVAASIVVALGDVSLPSRRDRAPIPAHEWSAALAMLGTPFACDLIARFGPGVFHYRYVLLTIPGAVLAAAFVTHHVLAGDPRLRVALMVAVATAGTYQMIKAQRESAAPDAGRTRQAALERMLPEGDLPVVHGTRSGFMEATRYASPALAPRMFYLTSREASMKWVGNDNGQRALTQIAPLVQGKVMDYAAFLHLNERFLLVSPRLERDWILQQLLEDGARIRTRAVSNLDTVLEVDLAPQGRGGAAPALDAPDRR